MREYQDKAELLATIEKTYRLFAGEFDAVPAGKINVRLSAVDKTPQEMLAYQLGWLALVMSWEQDELQGKTVITPSPDYKWNQLGLLYQQFYTEYGSHSLQELRAVLEERVALWCAWIERLSDEELFTSGVRRWSVTSANWPLWKWIHINSVAPFMSFRTKIRKWKKNV